MVIKDAKMPPPRNGAVARYRHARRIADLVDEKWDQVPLLRRHGQPPTFEQIEAILMLDDIAQAQDGEPTRWMWR